MLGRHLKLARARLAQSAERKTLNLVVVGSSPTLGGVFFFESWLDVTLKTQNTTPRLSHGPPRVDAQRDCFGERTFGGSGEDWPGLATLGLTVLFIIKEKAKVRERRWDGVGVMKDKKLKLEDVEVPHTLGEAWYILFEYIDPTEVRSDINLAEVEFRKPRTLLVVRLFIGTQRIR